MKVNYWFDLMKKKIIIIKLIKFNIQVPKVCFEKILEFWNFNDHGRFELAFYKCLFSIYSKNDTRLKKLNLPTNTTSVKCNPDIFVWETREKIGWYSVGSANDL